MTEKRDVKKKWLVTGLLWGLLMYVTMTFLYPLVINESISWIRILIGIPIWLLGGLGFGSAMNFWLNGKSNRK